MKLNTKKYKLSIYTEIDCDSCTKTKEILKQNNIPFNEKCISVTSPELKKQNGDTRWEYIDAESESNMNWYVPVLIIEDTENNITHIPTVQDKSLHLLGQSMDDPQDTQQVLTPYFI
tara:strand:- start:571 stop:921 length:351 start_codon:yes stop_codon:yes gene_type:complete